MSSLFSLLVAAYSCFNPARNHSNEYFSICLRSCFNVACSNLRSTSSSNFFLILSISVATLASESLSISLLEFLSLTGLLNISSNVVSSIFGSLKGESCLSSRRLNSSDLCFAFNRSSSLCFLNSSNSSIVAPIRCNCCPNSYASCCS